MPREIDLHFQGTPRSICCLEHDGVLVDPGPESCADRLLSEVAEPVTAVLLTHIHLDHAGAAGRVADEFPEAEVWVHERGARHVADPSKLVASATKIYGDRMEELWGRILPVPEDRLRVVSGDAGDGPDGWTWAYTPGHAQHHVCWHKADERFAYVGDLAGIRIGDGPVLAPTPPPDIDLGLWQRSLDVLEGWDLEGMCLTHFGTVTDVAGHVAALRGALDHWGAVAREHDEPRFRELVEQAVLEGTEDAATREAYFRANPPATLYAGLARYWKLVDEGRL